MTSTKSQRRRKANTRFEDKSTGNYARLKPRPATLRSAWVRQPWVICLGLTLAVLAIYSPVRHYPFTNYDDTTYVTSNPHVQGGLSWETIHWSVTATDASNWHPLTWISHALDWQLFGEDAGGHHITNALIHLVNVLLLFWLLLKATGAVGRSAVVAALFGLHPFNVGTVAWIAERKNVLSTLFLLLAFAAYGWYALKPNLKRYLPIMVLFALGLAAKPMIVTLPFALALLDYWPLRRIAGWNPKSETFLVPQLSAMKLFLEKLPLLALSAASVAITLKAQGAEVQFSSIPFGARLANAISSYALYIWKTIWPTGFSIFYPHPFATRALPPGPAAWAAFWIGLLLLTTVTTLAWRQRQTRPYLIVGWFWYVGTLVPVIGIVQVGMQGMADRYAYVPLIGIFVITAWGGNEIARHFHVPLVWRQILPTLILVVLAFLSIRQIGYWKTSLDLWTHSLAVTRNNYFADVEIGDLLAAEQKPEALQYYEDAVRIAPLDPQTHMQLALCLQGQGRLRDAIRHYQVFVHRSDNRRDVAFAYVNLSLLFGQLGELDEVRSSFDWALRYDPGVVDEMIGNFKQAAASDPSDGAYFCLGLLLEQLGQLPSARQAYVQALRLNPNLMEAKNGYARLQNLAQNDASK